MITYLGEGNVFVKAANYTAAKSVYETKKGGVPAEGALLNLPVFSFDAPSGVVKKPVFVTEDGEEIAVNVVDTTPTIENSVQSGKVVPFELSALNIGLIGVGFVFLVMLLRR